MWKKIISLTLLLMLALTISVPLQAQVSIAPTIATFTTSLKSVDRNALANRTARIPVSWTTANRPVLANLVFEQVMPDNSSINVELPRLIPWVTSNGDGVAAPILPAGNVTAIRLRVRLVNLITQATLDTKELTLPLSTDGSGNSGNGGSVATITTFAANIAGTVNKVELAAGTARVPVSWTSVNRPITATLVFDQVMPDGSLVNVELPRSTPWVNSSDKGVVAPRLPNGVNNPTEIRLRLRLVDLLYGRVLDQRDIAVAVTDGTTNVQIAAFNTPATSVSLANLNANNERVNVTWEIVNRPANSNLIFEQVLADGRVRNAELPRTEPIVPSSGAGVVALIHPGAANEVLFRVRLVDLGSNSTLAMREIKLPIAGSSSTGYTIVTGDACYQTPFPANNGFAVNKTGKVAYYANGASLGLYKNKAPDFAVNGEVKTDQVFTILEGPLCVINGNQAPFNNFRQWRVQAGSLSGWITEYSGNPQDGFVKYTVPENTPVTKVEILTLTVTPADKVKPDGTLTVSWEMHNASRGTLVVGSKTIDNPAANGTQTFNVKDIFITGTKEIRVALFGADQQHNSAEKLVFVPLETAGGLTINNFTVNPAAIKQGDVVTVTWDIAGTFSKAGIHYDRSDSEVPITEVNVTTNTGSAQITVAASVTPRDHTFTLWVQDANGVNLTKEVKVNVTCLSTAFFVTDTANQTGRCAGEEQSVQAAYQPFEHGFMLWVKQTSGTTDVFVAVNGGSITRYNDWDGSAYTITDTAPAGLLLPERGFGYVWNANAPVKQALGFATGTEQGYTAKRQQAIAYGKYDTNHFYLTLPDGRTLRYSMNYSGLAGWGFAG